LQSLKSNSQKTKPLIFLCHAKEDIQQVRKIYDKLKNAGLNPWLDEENIMPGQDWNLEIQTTIQKTDFALIFLSQCSVAKTGYVHKEIKWALEKQDEQPEGGIFLIPVKLDECELPYSLSKFQAVDLSDFHGMEKLIHTLKDQFNENIHRAQKSIKHLPNPYINREMLSPDSKMFFGRQKEINTICELLSKTKSVSIIGERRIGKSSLANRIYHELQSSQNTILIYIDCNELEETCSTRDEFFKLMNHKLKQSQNSNNLMFSDNYFNCYSTFKRFIEKQAKQSFKSIVFMDEFESLPKIPFADDTFFSNLRSIANNPANHFAFVTVSKKDLSQLAHNAIDSSNFWNIFHPQYLGMMDTNNINELRTTGFQNSNFELTENDLNIMNYYAGNFPFFNQIVCWYIYDSKIDQTQVNEPQMVNDLKIHYQTIWDLRTLQEQQLLKKLNHPKIAKFKFQMNDMLVRGLVEKKAGTYFTFSRFFDDLIQGAFKLKGK